MKNIVLLILLTQSLAANALPILDVSSSDSALGYSSVFSVHVSVSNVDPIDRLFAFGFDVIADTGLVYTGAVVTSPFFDDSAFFANTDVAGSTFPAVSGDAIPLVTLNFLTGTSEGVFDIAIMATPSDFGASEGLFTQFNTYEINQTIRVAVGHAAVPLPSSLFLFVIATVCIFCRSLRIPRRFIGRRAL